MRLEEARVSYSDLQQLPEDGLRYELYDGEVVIVPAPAARHQIVLRELLYVLVDFTRAHGGEVLPSPFDIVFSEYNVVQPDLVVFAPGREHCITLDGPARHAPDIAIEILSPSTATIDRGRKMRLLEKYGVPEYWLIESQDMRIEVFALHEGSYRLTQIASREEAVHSLVIANLTFPAARIFPF